MTRTAEPHSSSYIFNAQCGLSEQELARLCYTLFSHVRVRWYTDRLSECALKMPRTRTREFRKLTEGDRVGEVVVNVVRHDPQATPCEPTARAWRIPLQRRIRPDHMMGEELASAVGVQPT
jgi:hypothetical protein